MMNELLNNPLFQSAIAPLLVALVTGSLLRPLGGTWAGLGFAFGYTASIYFTMGFQVFPLTSTRKIMLLGAMAVIVGLLIDHYPATRRYTPWLLALLAGTAVVWLIWPVLKRAEGIDAWLMLSATIYAAWLVTGFESLKHKPLPATSAAVSLGAGTGISAVLGASALLGQLASAIGAASGAMILLTLLFRHAKLGSSFTLPVAMLSASTGVAAVIYAGLAWYALLPLALIPLAAHIPVKQNWNRFIQVIVITSYTVIPAAIAIAITWKIAQSVEPSFY